MAYDHEVTRLLAQWANGDAQALEQLTPLVYRELRQIAAGYLRRERHAQTLQPTALVHEAYLRLVNQAHPGLDNRLHFYGVAARLMRQILVDHARRRSSGKRAGLQVSLEEATSFSVPKSPPLLDLEASLSALEQFDKRKSEIIELRYFAGLSMDEIARTLSLSAVTIRRDLRLAEAWLHQQMQRSQVTP